MTRDPGSAHPRFPLAGVRWGLHAAFAVVLVILCGLGTWQVRRLEWKTQLIERIAEAQTAPAEPLNAVLNRLADHVDVDYVRVQFTCPGLEQGRSLQLYAVRDDGPGRRLVTACPIDGGPYRSLLVDRGFIAADKPVSAGQVTAPVVGVLRKPDRPGFFTPRHVRAGDVWYYRDTAEMAAALDAPAPAPVMVMLESPAPASGNPAPSPLPISVSNNHMGYAVTWFGLAVALTGVYIAFLRRTRDR
jgi:surfeit locus 1 family protein